MTGKTCHHCKQWVEEGEAHDCWTTTEAALTEDLSEELREAWERLREAAAAEGDQRIYASHHCIMFARRTAYFFVRPKRSYLELCLFLNRTVQAPQICRVTRVSSTRLAHIVRIRHRDEVERPLTDWISEAYALQDAAPRARTPVAPSRRAAAANTAGVGAAAPGSAERKVAGRKVVAAKVVARATAAGKSVAAPRTKPRPNQK